MANVWGGPNNFFSRVGGTCPPQIYCGDTHGNHHHHRMFCHLWEDIVVFGILSHSIYHVSYFKTTFLLIKAPLLLRPLKIPKRVWSYRSRCPIHLIIVIPVTFFECHQQQPALHC